MRALDNFYLFNMISVYMSKVCTVMVFKLIFICLNLFFNGYMALATVNDALVSETNSKAWFTSQFVVCSKGDQITTDTKVKYLSGTGNDDMVEWDFYCSEGMNSGKWTKIGVPSCWEQQGFGAYNYGSDPMEDRASEYGLYKRKFMVPKEWRDKDIDIVFEGVMTDCEVKINGKSAGSVHQGAFYEFKYPISGLLAYGTENVLEVKVNKVSANESVNHAEREADFWIFGGIYRPVYLTISPKENIDRVAINAQMNGEIFADVWVDAKEADRLELALYDLDGQKIQDLKINSFEKSKLKWSVSAQANHILSWNPERPHLYVLQFVLLDKDGRPLHKVSQRIGFRTVEVLEGDGIYVNGRRVKFKGVNRHSFHPVSGRTTSKSWSIEQATMIKDMNMNAVRMAHYPPDVHFLDVCDSLGLFVINEICTWHNPILDTKIARKIIKETVVRDVNHPCILLWANGNEQGWNCEVDDDFSKWDIQNREVIHPWGVFRKTNTIHYSQYHSLVNDAYTKDKILFPTEFLHGLYDGGHGAGLQDYWEMMWDMPLSAGGFLWDFADEGIVRTDKNGEIDLQGNKAPDGIVGPNGEKEASYFTIKEVWSPLYIEDRFIREDFNGLFRIENRYSYTNLGECDMTAQWVELCGPDEMAGNRLLSETKVQLPNLAPMSKGEFKVTMPDNWHLADVLYLKARDPYGKEIFTWSYPVASPKRMNRKYIDYSTIGGIKTNTSQQVIKVETDNVSYLFSKETGLLKEVRKGDRVIPLNNGPLILNQNDEIDSLVVTTHKDSVVIKVVFEASEWMPVWSTIREKRSDVIKCTVHTNGLLDLKVQLKGFRNLKAYRGITFSFPESEVAGMKWLGDGPYRVWRNRMKGTRFQVWENDYNNTVTGESGFVYPEFKGFFSNIYWSKIKGRENNGFTVYCRTPHTYLRMLTPQNPKGDHKGRVSPLFPQGDISFVMNIPAIGTKFQNSNTMGPHGNLEYYFGNDDAPMVMDLTFQF
ncbi:glycoside hydrolase family 2 protein [Saccharicrinis fermentans]|uniref:beta-galactosidase n=1 Tax=Saccharicrinis fermentans DSM 9555 = JCM 21142 TaxID=869213 RepID=W7YMR7_9BACT|nr:glycoside hydrolase family 2 TIM barrel-domain containing protein [Saccharicrinis fermentans]GAF03694.1 evolved beta-galactosidase subunit alpha [Saccharicrinis fermentans DSM 9555 = JCM 21142]